jgi:hypothetical protein
MQPRNAADLCSESMSSDAKISPQQFLSDLAKPAQRQDYAAKHRGVVMQIMGANDSDSKQQLMSLLELQ